MNSRDIILMAKKKAVEAAEVKCAFAQKCIVEIAVTAQVVLTALKAGRSVYLFGNGGSAADAQHIAAELQGKFYLKRKSLPAVALTTNTSLLTALGNDFGYDEIFVRQVSAHVGKGDVVIAISAGGNSPNVIKAALEARKLGAIVIGFTGKDGGKLKKVVDCSLRAPSNDVARIQECHITAGHIVCAIVETSLFA